MTSVLTNQIAGRGACYPLGRQQVRRCPGLPILRGGHDPLQMVLQIYIQSSRVGCGKGTNTILLLNPHILSLQLDGPNAGQSYEKDSDELDFYELANAMPEVRNEKRFGLHKYASKITFNPRIQILFILKAFSNLEDMIQ